MIKLTIIVLLTGIPVLKDGPCPPGYSSSGKYCSPSNDKAPIAVPKVGPCPSGYSSSGNYCYKQQH